AAPWGRARRVLCVRRDCQSPAAGSRHRGHLDVGRPGQAGDLPQAGRSRGLVLAPRSYHGARVTSRRLSRNAEKQGLARDRFGRPTAVPRPPHDQPGDPRVSGQLASAWLADRMQTQSPRTVRTVIVGILNVTPDSFSDGDRFKSAAEAIAAGTAMAQE